MYAWTILLNSAGLMVINNAASIAVAFGGTAILGMIVSLFNGIGRIFAAILVLGIIALVTWFALNAVSRQSD